MFLQIGDGRPALHVAVQFMHEAVADIFGVQQYVTGQLLLKMNLWRPRQQSRRRKSF